METPGIQGGVHNSVQAGPSTPLLQPVPPLPDFKQLYINDLRPDSRHRGAYVLLKLTTPPIRMTTFIHLPREDEIGDTVSVQLHHQGRDLQAAVDELSVGSVCIIKEPWFKMKTDGSYGLRVDHVGNVLWLPKADGRMPLKWRPQPHGTAKMAMQLTDSGNDALRVGNLGAAIEL